MSKQEADICGMVKYPVEDIKFKYAAPVKQDQFMMVSAYNISDEPKDMDIMMMFGGFDWKMWMAVMAGLTLFLGTLIAGRWFIEKKRGILICMWIIFTFMMDKDVDAHDVHQFFQITSTTLSLFCFFITEWLLGNVSTDLVVIDDPPVLESYGDVIARDDVITSWYRDTDWEYQAFEDSAEGSIDWEMMQHTKRIARETGRMYQHGYGDSMLANIPDVIKQKAVWIYSGVTSRIIAFRITTFLKHFQSDYPKSRVMLTSDERTKTFIQTFPVSPKVPAEKLTILSKKSRRVAETGLYQKWEDNYFERKGQNKPSIASLITDRIERVDAPTSSIAMTNVHEFLWILSIFIILASIVLLIEMVTKRGSQKKGRKEKRRKKKKSGNKIGRRRGEKVRVKRDEQIGTNDGKLQELLPDSSESQVVKSEENIVADQRKRNGAGVQEPKESFEVKVIIYLPGAVCDNDDHDFEDAFLESLNEKTSQKKDVSPEVTNQATVPSKVTVIPTDRKSQEGERVRGRVCLPGSVGGDSEDEDQMHYAKETEKKSSTTHQEK